MNAITARVPCVARTRTTGTEQFEESALTVRPWLPGTAHELGVVLRRGSREYLLNVAQAHALADAVIDAAETAEELVQRPRKTPHPQKS
ncbi:hypothetical protein [Corynebacterium terpenotabidum]|uniref:hypothetical protein n=1 Tax=Corynebacterium terpenotabidum TaxID=89154 RepID=UPI0004127BAF|nr:hypothetical protein [Corynebacterium terpenotabidum]